MGRDGSDLALPVEAVGFSGSEWLRKVAQDAATDEIKPSWMTARRPGATAAPATAPATQAGYAQMAGYAGVMNPMMAGMPPMGAWQPGMPMGYPAGMWGMPPPMPGAYPAATMPSMAGMAYPQWPQQAGTAVAGTTSTATAATTMAATAAAAQTVAAAAPASAPPVTAGLPAGWASAVDPKTGATYYYKGA